MELGLSPLAGGTAGPVGRRGPGQEGEAAFRAAWQDPSVPAAPSWRPLADGINRRCKIETRPSAVLFQCPNLYQFSRCNMDVQWSKFFSARPHQSVICRAL